MISLQKIRNAFGAVSQLQNDRTAAARRQRRARLALEPRAEGLEGRQVMAQIGLDPTFGIGGTTPLANPEDTATTYSYNYLSNQTLLSTGKYVAVGTQYHSASSSSFQDIIVQRVNSDGTVDSTFGSGGIAVITPQSAGARVDSSAVSVVEQADGKLVILATAQPNSTSPPSGYITDDAFVVVRLLANGSLDTSFNGTGYNVFNFGSGTNDDTASSLAIGAGGVIYAAGSTQNTTGGSWDFAVARLTTNGALDTSFNATGKQTVAFDLSGSNEDHANSVLVQPDGSVVLVGSATVGSITIGTSTMFTSDIAVARLTSVGALDVSFNTTGKLTVGYNLGGTNDDVGNDAAWVNNQIVVAGTSNRFYSPTSSGISDATLTKITTTGAVASKRDLQLVQQGISFSENVLSLNALSDGSLIIGGTANGFGNNSYGAFFTKLLPDGSADGNFGPNGTSILSGTGFYGQASVDAGGKISFVDYNGLHRTSAPTPQVVSAQIVFPSAARNATSNTIQVKFSTALNPLVANNPLAYRVRIGTRGNRFIPIRRVSYDPNTFTVTLTLRQRVNRRAVLQVLTTAAGVVGAESPVLNRGELTIIPVIASA